LPIYGDGANIRDWLHVEDHCRGIELVMTKGRRGETYNLGGHNELRNLEIVRQLCDNLDRRFAADPALAARFPNCPAARHKNCAELITFVKDRPGHDRRYAIDPRKAEEELGYAPTYSFEEGTSATIAWYLTHESWWREIMDGSYADWLKSNYDHR
jgi:dTDP-glucose 4,6-dehydratase